MKKRMTFCCLLAALLAFCCVFASAASTKKTTKVVDHVVYRYYEKYGKTPAYYAVTDFFDTAAAAKENKKKIIRIRESIGGVPVTMIETGTYNVDSDEIRSTHRTSNNVREIVLPDSITYISPSAFSDFGRLKVVRFPDSITAIPDFAFRNCTSLKKVEVKTLKRIGHQAFENCRLMYTFQFPDTLESIGERAFANTGLRKVSLPCKPYSGWGTFENCNYLTKVTFRDSIKQGAKAETLVLSSGMFQGCDYLKAVVFPKNTSGIWIENVAFESCDNLSTIKNVTKILSIDSGAFGYCWGLEKFVIPAGIQYVHPYAFLGSVKLKTVYLNSTDPTLLQRSLEKFKYFALQDGNFIDFLRNDCMIYVKTPKMKQMVQNEGLHSKVAVRVTVTAPQTLTATAADGTVTLQWSAVKNADGYGVFRYDAETKSYTPVDAAVDGVTCTIADAPQDAQYIVRACRVVDGDVSWSADSPAAAA